MSQLLSQDTLSSSEEFVFETVIEWLKANDSCTTLSNKLLRIVRFPQMEPSYIHRKLLQDVKLITKYPVVVELSREADKHFALQQAGYNIQMTDKKFLPRQQPFHNLVSNRFLSGHARAVTCFLKFDDKILSGSFDKSIKLWNSSTWECNNTIKTNEPILCMLNLGEEVLTGDKVGIIIVWNTVTWDRRITLNGHSDTVTCLISCKCKVISASYDRSVKVWNPVSWECERTVQHARAVTCLLQCVGDKVLSGSYDKTIKVWNTRNWNCESTLLEHVSYVTCLANCRDKVLSGSRDCTIKVWDTSTWQCTRTLVGHVSSVSCFLNCGDKLLSCSIDNTFKVWNPFTWECEKTFTELFGKMSLKQSQLSHMYHLDHNCLRICKRWRKRGVRNINCLIQSGDKILSGGSDKSIAVWNITTHNSHDEEAVKFDAPEQPEEVFVQ